jgi:hypothetical protein
MLEEPNKEIWPKTISPQNKYLPNLPSRQPKKSTYIFNHFEENKNHQLAKFRKPQNPAPNDLERKPVFFLNTVLCVVI